jgi:CheY-like chemotaxis protein
MSEGRILVVEDDFDISNMLQLYFKSLGYEVYCRAPWRKRNGTDPPEDAQCDRSGYHAARH